MIKLYVSWRLYSLPSLPFPPFCFLLLDFQPLSGGKNACHCVTTTKVEINHLPNKHNGRERNNIVAASKNRKDHACVGVFREAAHILTIKRVRGLRGIDRDRLQWRCSHVVEFWASNEKAPALNTFDGRTVSSLAAIILFLPVERFWNQKSEYFLIYVHLFIISTSRFLVCKYVDHIHTNQMIIIIACNLTIYRASFVSENFVTKYIVIKLMFYGFTYIFVTLFLICLISLLIMWFCLQKLYQLTNY